jgi:hypothetical protein
MPESSIHYQAIGYAIWRIEKMRAEAEKAAIEKQAMAEKPGDGKKSRFGMIRFGRKQAREAGAA